MKTLKNFIKYCFGKETSQAMYVQMRNDYVHSKYDIINKVSKLNSVLFPKYSIQHSSGVLGSLTNAEVNVICKKINTDGYYIFPNLLDSDKIEKLKTFASTTPVHYLVPTNQTIAYSKESVKYSDDKNKSNRYQLLDVAAFNNCPTALEIVNDANFLHVANNYLGTKPILDLITLWWSSSFKNLEVDDATKELLKNRSAQMFHFDMDRLKFLKFFIYLTDVDTATGPHVYVKGTHSKIPSYISQDGRYTDEHVKQHDGGNIIEINGKAGSIIAVDTRGLHKGKELENGERLIFQLEFTNSLFGNPIMPGIKDKFSYTGNSSYFDTYKCFYKK